MKSHLSSWQLLLLSALLGTTLVACGDTDDQGTASCDGVVCDSPPPAVCERNQLRSYAAVGDCNDGDCVYEVTVRTCAAGCSAGACNPVEPTCVDESCTAPPAAACDGDVAVVFNPAGACVDNDCSYTSSRIDCTQNGQSCRAGGCVDIDEACFEVTCDAIPPSSCDGNTRISYEDGLCEDGTCSYEPIRTNCASDDQICEAGACIDPADTCVGITCETPPANSCDGEGNLVSFDAVGECVQGECFYIEDASACPSGEICNGGQCVDPSGPCGTVTCNAPPTPVCEGTTAVSYGSAGICEIATGNCTYAPTRTNCASIGQLCSSGTCVPPVDPCAGVVCETAPAPACVGTAIVTYGAAGTCSTGTCSYPEASRVNCADTAQICRAAACITPLPRPTRGQLILTEVMPNPDAGADDQGEWFEIHNTTDQILDISGLKFREITERANNTFTLPAGAEIAPGQFYVLAISNNALGGGLLPDHVYTAATFNLANGSDSIVLELDGNVLFTFSYGTGTTLPTPTGASLSLSNTAYSNITLAENPNSWCNATVAFGTGDLGTPKATNGRCDNACRGVSCPRPADRCDDNVAVRYSDAGVCEDGLCNYAAVTTEEDCTLTDSLCALGVCVRNIALPEGASLTITEFLADPEGADTDKEWFEALYLGPDADLEGLVVTNGQSRSFTVSSPLEVSDGDYIVFRSVAAAVATDGPAYSWGGDSVFFLRNTTETIALTYGPTLLDSITFNTAAGWTVATGVSTGFVGNPRTDDNNVGANWCLQSSTIAGTTTRGTPGAENDACPIVEPGNAPAAGEVIIHEVMMRSRAGTEDPGEWIELRNLTSRTLALDGCVLRAGGFTAPGLPTGSTVAAGGLFLIGKTTDLGAGFTGTVNALFPTMTVTNGASTVSLTCAGTEIDAFPYAAGLSVVTRAAQLLQTPAALTAAGNDVGANWCVTATTGPSYGSFVLSGETVRVYGTPGAFNQCDAVTDPCAGITCTAPPATTCADNNTLLTYATTGTCAGGVCTYTTTEVDCGTDEICLGGTCLPDLGDLCEGVSCEEPPVDACEGKAVVSYSLPGTCTNGSCEYTRTTTPCGSGEICEDGICIEDPFDPCEGVLCATPPVPACDGDTIVSYQDVGTCDEGVCDYAVRGTVDCAATGQVCVDATCITALARPSRGDLVITEVMANPSGVEDAVGEWFEIYNTAGEDLNIGGLKIREVTERTSDSFVLPANTTIEAGTYFVFANNASALGTAGAPDFVWTTGTFTLGNTNDSIVLDLDGTALTTFVYGTTAGLSVPNGSALQLDPASFLDIDAAENVENWCRATAIYNAGDAGSPGADNAECAPVPTSGPAAGEVILHELMPRSRAGTDSGEYIELRNLTSRTISLSECVLTAGGFTGTLPTNQEIAANGLLLVGKTSDLGAGFTGTVDVVLPGLSISNSASTVTLACDGTTIDAFAYPGSLIVLNRAAQLLQTAAALSATGNDDAANWCVTSQTGPTYGSYLDGEATVLLYGSPGTANDCGEEVVVDLCEDVVCDDLPADTCEGDNVLTYVTVGECVEGECFFDATVIPCDAEQTCINGTCETVFDPCEDVTCDDPPGTYCSGNNLVTFSRGFCDPEGFFELCVYPETSTPCGANAACIVDACVPLPSAGDLVISEVMANPAGSDTGTEWFEIFNTSDQTLALTGLRVVDGNTDGFTISTPKTIGPNGFFVFAAGANALSADGSVAPGYLWSTFTLANTNDTIRIQTASAEPVILAAFTYGTDVGLPVPNGASLQLSNDRFDERYDDPLNWCTGVAAYENPEGVQAGTPGASNEACDLLCTGVTCPGVGFFCEENVAISILGQGTCFEGNCEYEAGDYVDQNCSESSRFCQDGACVLSATDAPVLAITEFLADPAGTDLDNEWFEVFNRNEVTANLRGVRVTNGEGRSFVITQDVIVGAGEYAVIAGSAATALNSTADVLWRNDSFFRLRNVSESITLTFGGEPVASLSYSSAGGWLLQEGRSFGFGGDPIEASAEELADPANWCLARSQIGSSGVFGTPGSANDDCDNGPIDARAPLVGEIVINELMVQSRGGTDNGEYIEFANVTDDQLSLGGCTLQANTSFFPFPVGTVLPPGALLLVGKNATLDADGFVGFVDVVFAGLAFRNSGPTTVALACDEVTLDSIVYTSTWYGTPTAAQFNPAALAGTDPATANDEFANWCRNTATVYGTLPGSDPATPLNGTPGSHNVCPL